VGARRILRASTLPVQESTPHPAPGAALTSSIRATAGWVHLFEPYRDVHEQNLKLMSDYYKGKRHYP
jgi:hypothetical protein